MNTLKTRLPCLMAIAALLVAWPALFSTLAPYDDEGYCMMTLRTYRQGERLYGATHTQYGPAYYQILAPIHDWLLPLTQTGVRTKTALVWIFSVMSAYIVAFRLSQSRAVAVTTALLVAIHLDKLALEPGHPQELVLVGFAMVAVVAIQRRLNGDGNNERKGSNEKDRIQEIDKESPLPPAGEVASLASGRGGFGSWFVLGLIAAVVGMTKLNCGLVIAVPMTVAAFSASPGFSRSRRLWPAAAAFPGLLIAWMAKSDSATMGWGLWIAASAAAYVARLDESQCQDSHRRLWIAVIGGGVTTSVAFMAVALLEGVTWQELRYGLVGQHADFADDFFKPPIWTTGSACAVLAIVALVAVRRYSQSTAIVQTAVTVMLLIGFASMLLEPLQHGLIPRGAGMFLVWFVPAWLGFFHVGRTNEQPGMRFVMLLAITSPLIAFPVSGTQIEIGTVIGLIVLGATFFPQWARRPACLFLGRQAGRLSHYCVMLLFAIAVTMHWVRYVSGVPLDLPGSAGMRLSKSVVDEQRSIVDAINQTQADRLIFEGHTNNRFFFWSDARPLTAANPTFWPRMLNEREQSDWLNQLDRPGKYCVVRVPDFELFYDERTVSLQERLRRDWKRETTIGEWEIGTLDVQ